MSAARSGDAASGARRPCSAPSCRRGFGILLLLRYAQHPVLFAAAGLALLVLKPARARASSAVLIPDAMGIPRV